MDALKEQIMMRKLALNPDSKKGKGEDISKKANALSKFQEILSDEENEDSGDDSDSDVD